MGMIGTKISVVWTGSGCVPVGSGSGFTLFWFAGSVSRSGRDGQDQDPDRPQWTGSATLPFFASNSKICIYAAGIHILPLPPASAKQRV